MTTPALVLVAVGVCVSCSTNTSEQSAAGAGPKSSTVTTRLEGVPGGTTVDTLQVTATVTAVDHAKREATSVTPEGKQVPYKAGPEVINFNHVQVGDQVKATVTEELVVYVRAKGQTRPDGQASLIALAPKGEKPGVLMVDSVEVTARVKSVDLRSHKATLEFPDGRTKTFAVRPDAKLSASDVGREVVIQATEAVAVRVEKP